MVPCFCTYLSPSTLLFSTSHLRSFCLSFLLLAILFTIINFLTTTTTIHRLTSTDYNLEINVTGSTTPFSLLSLKSDDVHHDRFTCYEQMHHQRANRKAIRREFPSSTVELNQPATTTFPRTPIPYDYNNWQSAPLMPRLVTKCEHNLMMQLLQRFDQLTKKYSLDYMMVDGTLLGSWRHHDLIPWDDDIDLLMSVQLKHRLDMAIQLESSSKFPYYIEFHRRWDAPKAFEYYKFYFSTSPRFSEYPWRYPFVDLIFYHENETHLWQENMQHVSSVRKESIFPLKLRPLGPLWLPAPRSPVDYFLSVSWTTVDQECFNGPWSHKYERTKDSDYGMEFKSLINCQELREYYPFVQRSATNGDERLLINGTVRQIIRMIDNE